LIVTTLIVASLVLGATVFKEQVAWAAQFTDVRITNVDANGNVKVHEQGTASVDVTNSPLAVHEQGTASVSGTVGVSSSANNPVFTATAGVPISDTEALQVPSGGGSAIRNIFVAAGRLRVTTFASAYCSAPTGELVTVEIVSGGDHGQHRFDIPLATQSGELLPGVAYLVGVTPVVVYAGSALDSSSLSIVVSTSDPSGRTHCNVGLSGYQTDYR
jgi:hypothetical protein